MKRLPVADSTAVKKSAREIFRHNKRFIITVTIIQILSAVVAVAIPKVMGMIVDTVSGGLGAASDDVVHRVTLLTVVALVIAAVGALLSAAGDYAARVMGEHIFATLRENLMDKVLSLPLSAVEAAGTGDLLGRTGHDLDRLRWVIQRGLARIIVIVFTVVAVAIASALTAPLLSVALLVPFLLMIPLLRWYFPRVIPGYMTQGTLWASTDGVIAETIRQTRTVEGAGLVEQRERYYQQNAEELCDMEVYTTYIRSIMLGLSGLVLTAPLLTVIMWGSFLLTRDATTLGAVTTLSLYALQLRGPVGELTYWMDSLQTASVGLARIIGVGLVPPDRVEGEDKPDGTTLSVKDVSFEYVPGRPVLDSINLDIRPGERLAIVGPSGSGKSTLGRLLAGINGPTSGKVELGGVELTSIPVKDLSKDVVLVTQEHHVFSTTLRENLLLAAPDSSEGQVCQALKAVGALSWAEQLEEGLDTLVGSGHYELTPGQAQQVALARIVLINPHTLVLDEATSLLDPSVARHTEQALDGVLAGRTVVAIAHRLYTAADADRVAVVIDGQIAELGSHEELLALDGHYATLWHAWQSQ
ncbi:ABC transporter ATP-binding protein [Actinomyces vulturis]|uniref:ABC transporter ATP-binding protein n=1 Tax=Actinomyces vulturis TaxID=1857645 RepID=UPI000834AC90|nr:ABC transporter ATP-binding protein [Actinomyces vulturis]